MSNLQRVSRDPDCAGGIADQPLVQLLAKESRIPANALHGAGNSQAPGPQLPGLHEPGHRVLAGQGAGAQPAAFGRMPLGLITPLADMRPWAVAARYGLGSFVRWGLDMYPMATIQGSFWPGSSAPRWPWARPTRTAGRAAHGGAIIDGAQLCSDKVDAPDGASRRCSSVLSQAASCASSRNSSTVCACAMSPGPQTIVGIPLL